MYCQVDGSHDTEDGGCGVVLFAPSTHESFITDDMAAEVLAFVGLSFASGSALETEVLAITLGTVIAIAHFQPHLTSWNKVHEAI